MDARKIALDYYWKDYQDCYAIETDYDKTDPEIINDFEYELGGDVDLMAEKINKLIELKCKEKTTIMKMTHEYDFHNGVQIEQSLIDRWTKESLEYFKKNPNEHTCTIRTGNGLVIAIKEGDYEIRVFQITNGYNLQEYTID